MDVIGTLKQKSEIIAVNDNFNKREFVLTLDGEYPQHVQFELTQQKCNLIDATKIGQQMKVYFNLRGREWTNKEGELKYFNSLQAWKIETIGDAPEGALNF